MLFLPAQRSGIAMVQSQRTRDSGVTAENNEISEGKIPSRETGGKTGEQTDWNGKNWHIRLFWGRKPAILQEQFRKGKIRTFSSNKEDFFPFKSEETVSVLSSPECRHRLFVTKSKESFQRINFNTLTFLRLRKKNSATTKQGKWKLNKPASFVTDGC